MAKRKKKDKLSLIEHGLVCRNKTATYKYEIVDTREAGMVLLGSEVKSLRLGDTGLKESFAIIKNGEVWLINAHIPPYDHSHQLNHEPTRRRKLLLHKSEIRKLTDDLKKGGLTLVPMEIHFNDRGYAKIVLALARGKRQYDKRQAKKKKEIDDQLRRRVRNQ